MTKRLAGRSAIVTGGAQGLGYEYEKALANAGATALINDIGAAAERAAAELDAGAGACVACPGDISEPGFADELVNTAVKRFGNLDIIVNNAGISRPAMLWNLTDEQWHDVIRVNLTSVFYGVRAAARVMLEQGRGRIINVSSAAGIDGSIGQINYAAAKAGVIGITKSAARELGRYGVNVNAIAPVASTPMTRKIQNDERIFEKVMARIPLHRYAQPDEIAPAVVFLASDDASYMTGHVLLVDGGMSM